MKEVFKENVGNACYKISNNKLIKNLKEMYEKLGRTPKKEDLSLKNGSKYSINAYKRAFGSLSKSLLVAGFKPNQVRNKTKKEIIDDLKQVYKKLGRIPTQKEYYELSNIRYCSPTFKKIFGSWSKALLEAGIISNISRQNIINSLIKWYKENNNDIKCLEYWSIRNASKDKFPYSCYIIKKKFNYIAWEDIMKKIDPKYNTINQFHGRGYFKGDDGNIYLSSIEKTAGDILFKSKHIKRYKYESLVCESRQWTCDFFIELKNGKEIWLEIDGMKNNRKHPYDSGENEKIEYYKKNNINYKIISYKDNVENFIKQMIEEYDED